MTNNAIDIKGYYTYKTSMYKFINSNNKKKKKKKKKKKHRKELIYLRFILRQHTLHIYFILYGP